MALSGTTNTVSFTPTAGTTSLTFSIPFFDATTVSVANKKYGDIKVTRTRSGTDLLLTPVTSSPTADQFQLSATNGDPSQGGVITIAASSSGDKFTVERDVEYTQQYDLQDGATIDPTALNKAFDRVVAQNQQQNDLITRTVEFPVSDDPARTYTVGTETERANKALGFDASGNVTELDLLSSGTISGNTNAGISVSNNIISAKVDGSSTAFDGNGNIIVKDSGVTAAKLNTDAVTTDKINANAVTTAKILNDNVTYDKIQDISTSNSVLGNTGTGTVAERALVGDILLNEPTMTSNSAVKGVTQQSIKSYVDSQLSSNKVMNVQQTVKTNRTTTGITHTAYNDIPDLSVNITPSATSSKVLVTVHLNASTNDTDDSPDGLAKTFIRLNRDSTAIALGDSDTNYEQCTFAVGVDAYQVRTWSITFLDSPSTTSQVTYKLKAKESDSDAVFLVNQYNAGGSGRVASVSSITVQEIYQ